MSTTYGRKPGTGMPVECQCFSLKVPYARTQYNEIENESIITIIINTCIIVVIRLSFDASLQNNPKWWELSSPAMPCVLFSIYM